MLNLKENVEVKIELMFAQDFEEDDSYNINILLGDLVIGDISLFRSGIGLRMDLIDIEEGYRGKGYGTIAMEALKELARKNNIEYITGECPRSRNDFYSRLGATFECRHEYDETFINNVFYIDLIDAPTPIIAFYDYECEACDEVFQIRNTMHESGIAFCPYCGTKRENMGEFSNEFFTRFINLEEK